MIRPALYWEERARRFATEGDGLAAVCSYGMPAFYNRMIHTCQRLALEPWLRVRRGTSVLDVGCGVGRWSRELACRGARVTGIDLSPTMIAQAKRRAAAQGVAGRCRFLVQDLALLDARNSISSWASRFCSTFSNRRPYALPCTAWLLTWRSAVR